MLTSEVPQRHTVSAMLVARTILRTPIGGLTNTLRWSAAGTMLCSGSTEYLLLLKPLLGASSWSFSLMISSQPADWASFTLTFGRIPFTVNDHH